MVLIVTPSWHILARSKMLTCSSWQYIFLTFSLLPEHTLKKIVLIFLPKPTTLLLFIKLLLPRVRRPDIKKMYHHLYLNSRRNEISGNIFISFIYLLLLKINLWPLSLLRCLLISSLISSLETQRVLFYLPNILIISCCYELSAVHTLKCFSN